MLNVVLSTLGAILLGGCALPQVWKSWQSKRSDDISWLFLIAWFLGDICLLCYGIRVELPFAIVLNNAFNALCIIVIAWFK